MEGRVALLAAWLSDAFERAVPYLVMLALALALYVVWA
jgi:hypothetical protein